MSLYELCNWTTKPSKGALFRRLTDVCVMLNLATGEGVMNRVGASFTSASRLYVPLMLERVLGL